MEEDGRDQIGNDYSQDQHSQQQYQQQRRRHSFSTGQQPGGLKRRRNRTQSPPSRRRLRHSFGNNNIALPQQWQRQKKKKKKNQPTTTQNYHSLSLPASSNPQHQNENHGSMPVVHVSSIVGSRPLGWGKRHQRTVATSGSGSGGSQSLQHHLQNRPMTKAGALAAATRTPLATRRTAIGSHADDNPNSEIIEPNKLWDGRSPMMLKQQEQVIAAEASDEIHRTLSSPIDNNTRSISFTPSFLPSSSSANKNSSSVLSRRNHDAQMDEDGIGVVDDFEDNEQTTTDNHHQFSSPVSNRNDNRMLHPTGRSRRTPSSKNKVMGPLGQRFANLLKQRSNDLVRLQNPAFNNSIFDLNDPRKRAKTYTDITILGQGGWSSSDGNYINANNNSKKLTVLVYVHHHVLKQPQYDSATTTEKYDTADVSSRVGEGKEGMLAWACFHLSTLRAIVGGQLRGGISMRLYNAQFIQSRYPVRIDPNSIIFHSSAPATTTTTTTGVEAEQQQKADTVCRYFIICTSLCEMYPQKLEPLPNVLQSTA